MTDERDGKDSGHRRLEEAATEAVAKKPAHTYVPKQIGQFHIKDILAWGGMGVVYRAVQEQPRRTVAVKLMKHGIASRSAMRRFEYESQILARLHHPGIAQVYDAGTHDDGSGPVPYFAMEYVPNAKSITRYADDKSLGTRERLELFTSVCDAVHHGHQKGIIHRDLKPDNILVDQNGDVKIIDFGVARGTDSDLAVTTLQTEIGQLIGTLQYMSPEQCEGDPDAIDARSDVYALGVVLYELLTGRLPYKFGTDPIFRSAEVICNQAPTKPSTIDKMLRGDVETIVLQTLEKDPARRYPSAVDLEKDIRCYLDGEAIQARPPSTAYQVQLFARRHRVIVGTVVLMTVIATVAAFLVTRSLDRARHAEGAMAEALERATQAEISAAASKRTGVPEDQRTEDLVGQKPGEFSLTTRAGETIDLADLADHKATVLNFVAPDCPFCLKQIPLVERSRVDYEPRGVRFVNVVLPFLKKHYTAQEAWDSFSRLGSQIEVAIDESDRIGDLFRVTGFPTITILDGSGEIRHASRGARNDLTNELRGQLDALILGTATPQEKLAEAEKLHRQTLENNRTTLGEGHRDTLRSMENLAATLTQQRKHDEAEELHREIWHVRERFLGENDPQTLESMHKLAVVLHEQDKPAESEILHRQVLEGRQRVLGMEHEATRLSMAHLGMVLLDLEKADSAEPYVAELIEWRKARASQRDASAVTLNQYAWLLLTCEPLRLRDPATALDVARTAAELSGRQDAGILDTLALAQKMTGDLAMAIATQKEAVLVVPLTDFRDRSELESNLAGFYKEAGDLEALEQWYRDDLARARASMPAGSLLIAGRLAELGGFLMEMERHAEAEPTFKEAVEIGREALPENHWVMLLWRGSLGYSILGQGRFEEAEPLIVGTFAGFKDNPGVPPEVLSLALDRVVQLYADWGKPEEASRYRDMQAP